MKNRTNSPKRPARLPLVQPGSPAVDPIRFPDIADLAARLQFSPQDGTIWLDNQRMLLIHSRALGALRRELIESLGVEGARGLLTRMGYFAGSQDAAVARRVRPNSSPADKFSVGPQLHALEGIVQVEAVRVDIDVQKGTYYGEFVWRSSSEDEEHTRHFGLGSEPTCWMQIGYASGYTTEFMGRPVFYREVECQSMGHGACRIIGRPVEHWGPEAADDLSYLRAEGFTKGVSAHSDSAPMQSTSPNVADSPSSQVFGDEHIVGVSPAFNSVCHMVKRVASTQATVLLLGESGVGKEVFARAVHRTSPRSQMPLVAVNCAAIPETLVESELFGVERGAFTGAQQSRPGRFERADKGTLFLDEIGILSPSAQGKLLRVLQEGELERLGDQRLRRVDVRLVAATNLDLRVEVEEGRFREDLFFRLNVFPIRVPPLRERHEDIPVLMNYFLDRYARRHGRRPTGFTSRAIDAMMSYRWPGNIRELENAVERGVILATDGHPIDVGHLFISGEALGCGQYALNSKGSLVELQRLQSEAERPSTPDIGRVTKRLSDLLLDTGTDEDVVRMEDIETLLLTKALRRANGNLAAAARLLGITRPQMVYRLKSHRIEYVEE